MKVENKPYPHFCTNCARQIGENDREFWFDVFDQKFCSMECISEYYDIGIDEVEDAIWEGQREEDEEDEEQ